MFCIVPAMGAMCCWVSAHSLSSSFLSWFWCWWLLGLSASSRKSPRLRQWLHPRWCGGRVWKCGQQSHSWSNLFTAWLCSGIRLFSVRSVSPMQTWKSPDKELHSQPLSSFQLVLGFSPTSASVSLFWRVWRQPSAWWVYVSAGFFNLLWHPYGRHKTCTLLSSVSLSFTISSSSLSLSSSFL